MFEDSLLESGGGLIRRNPWTTALSFALQILAGASLVLMSLVYTETLPTHRLTLIEAPAPRSTTTAPPEQHPAAQSARPTGELTATVLVPPREIPRGVSSAPDSTPPGYVATDSGSGALDGVVESPGTTVPEVLRPPPAQPTPTPATRTVRVSSGVAQGLLLRQVKPAYPPLALQARIQGTVVLQAVIGKDGLVQDLHVVSGHPLLTGAAIAAARQWLYRPYFLNGEPVEVDTQINVIFTLNAE